MEGHYSGWGAKSPEVSAKSMPLRRKSKFGVSLQSSLSLGELNTDGVRLLKEAQ